MKENELPTVKVKSGDSFATINKSDYDPGVHELINEDDSQANESALEQNKEKDSPGQGGSGKRSGARGRNKKEDAAADEERTAGGPDVPEGPVDGPGDTEESAARTADV